MGFIDLIVKDSEGKSERELLREILRRQYHIEDSLQLIHFKLNHMAIDVTALQAAVDAEGTALDSAIALLNTIPGLIAQIPVGSPDDQAKVDAITAQITSKTADIQAALTADSPAPAPTPAPGV